MSNTAGVLYEAGQDLTELTVYMGNTADVLY